MQEESFEKRVATIVDAVKKTVPGDSSIGVDQSGKNDGLDLLVDAIEDLLRRSRENVTAFSSVEEAMQQLQIPDGPMAKAALSQVRNMLMETLAKNLPDKIYFKDTQGRFLHVGTAQANAFSLRNPAEAIGKTDFDFFTEEHAREAFQDEQRIMRTGEPIVNKVEKGGFCAVAHFS
jgi:PAS domain-containing protein